MVGERIYKRWGEMIIVVQPSVPERRQWNAIIKKEKRP
jgi:hypothetical protein